MKRMICFVTGQPLPNYIPVHEPATRPDVLYGFCSPQMKARWAALTQVIARNYPTLQCEEVPLLDAYNADEIKQHCVRLLRQHKDDEWMLNATGGTKLMSAPAIEVFRQRRFDIYYVESSRQRTLQIGKTAIGQNWTVTELPFTEVIDLHDYFGLFEQRIKTGSWQDEGLESEVFEQLNALELDLWASVRLMDEQHQTVNEFDIMGLHHYQLFVFDCARRHHRNVQEINQKLLKDLEKLFRLRHLFGGPFSQTYWVFRSHHQFDAARQYRLVEANVRLIQNSEIRDISRTPHKFNLPPRRNPA